VFEGFWGDGGLTCGFWVVFKGIILGGVGVVGLSVQTGGVRPLVAPARICAAEKRAIQSFRLRLHSGLRQQGRRLRRGWFMARLKPCPFEVVASMGGGGGLYILRTHASEARHGAPGGIDI
jgi:hypothetical protein